MNNSKAQSGRSMVEIIAVLAVIGVLTVGGVEGYSYAMKKNEANNVAEKVSILAHEVSQQMMRGHTPEDVTDLVKDVNDVEIKVAKYTPTQKKYADGKPNPENDDQFSLEVKGLKPEVAKILLSSGLASEPGLQKIQQNNGAAIQDITGTQGLDETSGRITLGLVFSKDLSDTCPAGEYKVDGLCQEATGNNISSGDGVLKECGKATKPNSEHTECINCAAGEDCGCENNKMSSGKGHCVDCVKNSNCGENKWCDNFGNCFACPDNGTCAGDKTGFTCNPGYKSDDNGKCVLACPSGTSLSGEGGLAVTLSDSISCYCENKGTTYQSGVCSEMPSGCNSFKDCNKGQFCKFNSMTCDDSCFATDGKTGHCSSGTGTCTDISGTYAFPSTPISITGIGHTWKGTKMNWYSANDWSQANGKEMISIEDIKCYRAGTNIQTKTGDAYNSGLWEAYCCASGKDCTIGGAWSNRTSNGLFSPVIVDIASKYGNGFNPLTSSFYSGSGLNSCYAFAVYTSANYEGWGMEGWAFYEMEWESSVLCK